MKMVSLGEVASLDRKSVSPESLPSDTIYVGLEHIARGGHIIGSSTVGQSQVTSNKFRFTSEHLLFGRLRPNLAKISLPEYSGICSSDILPIKPSEKLDRSYLAHYLRQPTLVQLAALRATGINLPRISPSVLAELPVPLPSIAEQKRISYILDRVEAVREKQQQIIDLYAKLTQAIFQVMFGEREDGYIELNSISEVSSGITKGRRTTKPTIETPYLAVANVQAGHLDLDEVKSIGATEAEIARYALNSGDIVLTEGGDPDKLGRGTVWRNELPTCIHQNHIFRVRPGNEILSDYLSAYLASHTARSYFLRSAKQTTGIASINITQLRATPVLIPPISEQELFVTRIRQIAIAESAVQKQQQAATELFASLQAQAFRGDL